MLERNTVQGKIVYDLRKRNGESLKKMSVRIGFAVKTIGMIERGQQLMTVRFKEAIAENYILTDREKEALGIIKSKNGYTSEKETELGKFLVGLRESRGDTIKDMADKIQISKRTLHNIETGKISMTKSLMHIIINVYDLRGEKLNKFKRLSFKSRNTVMLDMSGLSEYEKGLIHKIIGDKYE